MRAHAQRLPPAASLPGPVPPSALAAGDIVLPHQPERIASANALRLLHPHPVSAAPLASCQVAYINAAKQGGAYTSARIRSRASWFPGMKVRSGAACCAASSVLQKGPPLLRLGAPVKALLIATHQTERAAPHPHRPSHPAAGRRPDTEERAHPGSGPGAQPRAGRAGLVPAGARF